MAMPPTPAAAPAAAPGAAAGADPTMAAGTPPDDMGAPDDAGDDEEVLFTVKGKPSGPYTLIQGDEDDENEGAEGDDTGAPGGPPTAAMGAPPSAGGDDEGQTFDTPQELMKAIMMMLESGSGAEEAFGAGFKGDKDDAAAKPMGM